MIEINVFWGRGQMQNFAAGGWELHIRPMLSWPLGARWCVAPAPVPTIDRVLAHRGGVIGRGSTSPANACAGFDPGGGGFGGYGTPLFALASGHTAAGAVIPGRRYRYPEPAATGLHTTVLDLCQLVRYLKSELGGYPERGMGYAVLVNGDRGEPVSEIVAAIKAVYGLP